MNHIQKDLADLKEGIDSAKTNLAKLEGVESEILNQLKKEYGISSVEEAKTMLSSLTKELEDHKKNIEQTYSKLKEDYQW
jgi:F0F1-type ATP synthase membrane subunit b/b'